MVARQSHRDTVTNDRYGCRFFLCNYQRNLEFLEYMELSELSWRGFLTFVGLETMTKT
jgi:hypothetical protein